MNTKTYFAFRIDIWDECRGRRADRPLIVRKSVSRFRQLSAPTGFNTLRCGFLSSSLW
jgi:hypothetical protein